MPYSVNYSDSQNKTPITVFDSTVNEDTSLRFPGRNIPGYGQIIAENFLSLLENFASPNEPKNPTEGQIWFNSDPSVSSLLIWDGVSWKAASGVQKSPIRPSVDQSKVGELWVDTVNQQLYVFSGIDWILVGPNFSTGLRSGLIIEQIIDSNDIGRVVLTVYVEDRPVVIISKDSFTPKVIIPQFSLIRAGINIATPNPAVPGETSIYQGGLLPKLYGTALAADGLNIAGQTIPSTTFLRNDSVNVVSAAFNIRNNSGLTIGSDGLLNISTSPTASKFFNNLAGSSIEFQLSSSGLPSTILKIQDEKVGVNNNAPAEALDVVGNIKSSGSLVINDTSSTTNLNTGAVRIAGGVSISKNLLVNEGLRVNASSQTQTITPAETDLYDLGSTLRRWNTVRAKTLIVESIEGILTGSITGNAGTASALQQTTTFNWDSLGDVTANSIEFNGLVGGTTKTFRANISPSFISTKQDIITLTAPQRNFSQKSDVVLIFRPSVSGLLQANRDTFVGDLGIPIGAILPFAGLSVPFGFLLCDGSEVIISKYIELFQTIGPTYNGSIPLLGQDTFRLPDLRGRFPLGRDNMDNGEQVQTSTGAVIDGGGGNADRVPGVEADTLGASGGDSLYSLSTSNLPQHEHNLRGSTGQQYYAANPSTAVPVDTGSFLGIGGTTANRVQFLPTTGGITGLTGQPYSVMNPFLTMNYIIRSGPPAF
jgi:microcystin-dependent protein